jgi:hypothetical protein
MSYETNSAIVVLYDSKEFKALDKKTSGQLSSVAKMKKFDENETAEVTISFPSKVNVDSITVVKTNATSDQDWRDFGGKYAKAYKGKADNL